MKTSYCEENVMGVCGVTLAYISLPVPRALLTESPRLRVWSLTHAQSRTLILYYCSQNALTK